MLPTALISRPDHNAPFSREVHVCAPAELTGDFTGGHHPIARQLAEPQARSTPPARKGRSKAEWLDCAEDRRTISRRDGRTLEQRRCSARERETNETRKVGKQSGGDGAVPSQAEIQCECAFTHMNAVFRKNLTDALAVDANGVDTASDTGGALNDGRERARFCRMNATCIWGVSDPRFSGRRTSTGGWQRGSLAAADNRTHCDTGGTGRRPLRRSEVAHCTEHRRINAPCNHVDPARAVRYEQFAREGEH
jgi:hypothetical protein